MHDSVGLTEIILNLPMNFVPLVNKIEKAGNRLPPPAILFFYLCITVFLFSLIASLFSLSAQHPITGENIFAVNLLSQTGLHKILTQTVSNFVQFAPVGTVLVAILGLGIAEKSGLIDTLLKLGVNRAPQQYLTFIVVMAGILSNIAMDSGYVVLIPLAAIVFKNAGLPPLAGIAAAFAGVSGGFSANLLIGPVDTILAGISTESAQIVKPLYEVSATANYYFMIASTILVAVIGTLVTNKIILPKLGGTQANELVEQEAISLEKIKALKWVGGFTLLFVSLILVALIPESGILRHPEKTDILQSPFIRGIVTLIAVYAAVCGIIFGKVSGSFKNDSDITEAMDSTMSAMGSYLVLMFFAAQFVNYFAWSQIGTILAINGASILTSLNIHSGILLTAFIFIAAFINLFVGSASAKWALLAPVFVPMLLLVGISPEATQVAFRIGDSTTNIITPLMPYFGVVYAFAKQHDKNCGVGTLIAIMLPYSLAFLIGWSGLMLLWFALDLPLGPNAYF